MITNHSDEPWLDLEFFENQRKIRPEQLLPYAGQHVAWSWDGASILACAAERETLRAKLQAAGIDCRRVFFAYIDSPDLVNL